MKPILLIIIIIVSINNQHIAGEKHMIISLFKGYYYDISDANTTENETIIYDGFNSKTTYEDITVYNTIYECDYHKSSLSEEYINNNNINCTQIDGQAKSLKSPSGNNLYLELNIPNEEKVILTNEAYEANGKRFSVHDYLNLEYDDIKDLAKKEANDNNIPTYNFEIEFKYINFNSDNTKNYEFKLFWTWTKIINDNNETYRIPFKLIIEGENNLKYEYSGIFNMSKQPENPEDFIVSSDIELNSNNETATFTWDMMNSCILITRHLDNSTIIDGCSSN